MEWWILFFVGNGFRTQAVATTVWATGCVHTHSTVARSFFCTWRVHSHICTSHACAHTRMAQLSLKKVCCANVVLSISISPSHVSPIFAVPARLLRHHVSVNILSEIFCPKSAGQTQLRTSTESLATLPSPVYTHFFDDRSCSEFFEWRWHFLSRTNKQRLLVHVLWYTEVKRARNVTQRWSRFENRCMKHNMHVWSIQLFFSF